MARRVASETAPSAPRRGFLASITSAPPSRAARASRASATLTSSCIGALLPPATADRLGFHNRDVKATGGGRGDDGPAAGTTARGGPDPRRQRPARHRRLERHRARHRAGMRGGRRRSGAHLPGKPHRGGRGGGKRARRGAPGRGRPRRCVAAGRPRCPGRRGAAGIRAHRRLDQQRRRRHPDRRGGAAQLDREARPPPCRGPARHGARVVDRRGADARAACRRRHPQHVVGPCPHGGDARRIQRGVLRGEGRRVQLQPRAGAVGGAPRSRERAGAGVGRDRVRPRTRPRCQAPHHRVHPPQAVGDAPGHRACRSLPRLGCGRIRHRTDAPDQRRRHHVAQGRRPCHEQEGSDLLRGADPREAQGVPRMVVRGRLDPPQLQDRWLADHADAGHRHRVSRRGGVPSSRPRGHLGTCDREAEEPCSGRRYRQGLRAGPQDRGGRAVAAGGGRRARRDAQQVRALRRSAVSGGRPPAGEPRRGLFVTGELGEPALRRTLGEMAPPFAYDVAVMRITVAALMTTPWIARFLEVPPDTDLVLIPGLCEGDPAAIAAKARTRVEKGPKDLREIPDYFGQQATPPASGAYDIEIVAEVNNAPRLPREAVRREAEYYRASGADVIDIGCTPGLAYPDLSAVVGELVAAGMRVSIDSFDLGEIRAAVAAGAELVLSVNGSNLDAARELAGTKARVVAIPDFGTGLETLEPTVAALERWGVPHLIDPIIEPIGFGFMASLERFAETHRRYPAAPLFIGIGNITELTAADTTGVNALLVAICEEVGVRAVLTTEVIPWARGAVREIDIARRLMHHAIARQALPKGVDDRLVTLKDPKVLAYGEEELRALHRALTDPNFRVFADGQTITVFNNEIFVRGTDINELFAQLGVDEATHAFYLGRELMKAKIAITLGKTYRQEGQLQWGYLTPPDEPSKHVQLTQRSRRRRARR